MSGEWSGIWSIVIVALAFFGLLGAIVWHKGRPFAEGEVFRASRLSEGGTAPRIVRRAVADARRKYLGRAK